MVTYMAYAFSGAASNLDDSAYAVTIKPIYWHSSSSTDFVIFRCNRLNWVFALSGTVFVSTTHFIVVLRLFNLPGHSNGAYDIYDTASTGKPQRLFTLVINSISVFWDQYQGTCHHF
ncbi:hypothetical protein MPER_07702 [Moniliophthora perniciosa FA553]|nr:hypothetical protein MPER_07702 [Moniliophthora perniciosa FA553]